MTYYVILCYVMLCYVPLELPMDGLRRPTRGHTREPYQHMRRVCTGLGVREAFQFPSPLGHVADPRVLGQVPVRPQWIRKGGVRSSGMFPTDLEIPPPLSLIHCIIT